MGFRSGAAHDGLRGLALGDAFGEQWFFRPAAELDWLLTERLAPAGPWRWTDDTAMALSVYQMPPWRCATLPPTRCSRPC